jgi:hypothetical protein
MARVRRRLMVDGVDVLDRCIDATEEDAWSWYYRRARAIRSGRRR